MTNKNKKWKRIKDFYKKNNIADDVANIRVNAKRLNQGLDNPNLEVDLDRQYKKYGITRFNNQKEFYDANIDKFSLKEIKRRWNQYQHREDLMISGQYEDYRDSSYRQRYLQVLESKGISDEIIAKLRDLNKEDWLQLIRVPKSDTTSNRFYNLPQIQDYYIVSGIDDSIGLEEIEGDIMDAWKEAFNKPMLYEDDDDLPVFIDDGERLWYGAASNEFVNDSRAYKEVAYTRVTKTAKVLRKVPKRYREDIDFTDSGYQFRVDNKVYDIYDKEGRFALIQHMERKGTAKLRTTKRGTQYYPFYLNRQETAEYIAWKRNREK